MITSERITAAVRDAVREASTGSSPELLAAYAEALNRETNANARWALENLIANRRAAAETGYVLCDDTGIPHVIVELGDEARIEPGFMAAVAEGVRTGLQAANCRPMGVLGDDRQRIDQSAGLSSDPGDVMPAPVLLQQAPGAAVRIHVLMLGGGPEIRAKTLAVFHQHSVSRVLDTLTDWICSEVAKLGCTPCVPFVGIGRTHYEAAALALAAYKDADFTSETDLERELTARINATGVGPLGLGGGATALRSFIRVGPQRASGVRVVSYRLGCAIDPRRAVRVLE